MVLAQYSEPLSIKQESTSYDVAASELSNPLGAIIDVAALLSKEKWGKIEEVEWIIQKPEIVIFIDLSASVEKTKAQIANLCPRKLVSKIVNNKLFAPVFILFC